MGSQVSNRRRLGDWASKSNNTVYQAATDGSVCAENNDTGEIIGYTDGDNPPVTIITRNHNDDAASGKGSGVTMPVRRGDYWKIVNADSVRWIPS